jgi:CheY-like chemotaxis protein
MITNRPVLYVEDDQNDAFFMERAFQLAAIANPLSVATSGELAIEYLSNVAQGRQPSPCLIILDMKMPFLSGLDVLDWIRATEFTKVIPVIMFTSSNQNSDMYEAYTRGANGYVIKPGKPNDLLQMAKGIRDFWLTQNHLPEIAQPDSR